MASDLGLQFCQCPCTKTSPGFTDNSPYRAFGRHSDKNYAAIKKTVTWISYKSYLRGLTLLLIDSHVDNSISFVLGIELGSETTGFGFHIVNTWLVHECVV